MKIKKFYGSKGVLVRNVNIIKEEIESKEDALIILEEDEDKLYFLSELKEKGVKKIILPNDETIKL